MNIEISPATIADSAGIAHVQITSYRTAYAPFFPQAYLDHFTYAEQDQDWRDLIGDRKSDFVLVAVQDAREIVGYALGKMDSDKLKEFESELVALHVLPEFQHNGIGGKLFSAMAHEFRARGKNDLYLWTLEGNPVRAWYERLGGKLVGEKNYDVDDVTITEVAYGWNEIDSLLQILKHTNGA